MPDLHIYGYPVRLPKTLPLTLDITNEGPLCVSVPISIPPTDAITQDGQLVVHVDASDRTLREAINQAEERRYVSPRKQGGRVDDVPVRAITAEAVRQQHKGDITWYELAHRLGYVRMKDGQHFADITRVKRVLGLTSGEDSDTKMVRHDTAVSLCEALDVDPVEVGI